MAYRMFLPALFCTLVCCLSLGAQSGADIRSERIQTCDHFCYGLVLKGRLIDTFAFSRCEAISGMTCHIALKNGAQLPSRVFVQALDSRNQPLGKRRLLIYPELKAGEAGSATFPLKLPDGTKTVILTGEWNGPYRSAY